MSTLIKNFHHSKQTRKMHTIKPFGLKEGVTIYFRICIHLQWLSELIECGNLQIGKTAVALWIPMTQKRLIPHLKALNVSFNLKHQTLQKL